MDADSTASVWQWLFPDPVCHKGGSESKCSPDVPTLQKLASFNPPIQPPADSEAEEAARYNPSDSPSALALLNRNQSTAEKIGDTESPQYEQEPCIYKTETGASGPNDSPPVPALQNKECQSSGSPPIPALLNKQNVDVVEGSKTAGDADLPYWERPPRVLPALVTKERGRLKIRTNNAMKIRKMLNEREDSAPDRRKNVGRKRPTTKVVDSKPTDTTSDGALVFSTDTTSEGPLSCSMDTTSVDELAFSVDISVDEHTFNTGIQSGRTLASSTDDASERVEAFNTHTRSTGALAFCMSPPGKVCKLPKEPQHGAFGGPAHHTERNAERSVPGACRSYKSEAEDNKLVLEADDHKKGNQNRSQCIDSEAQTATPQADREMGDNSLTSSLLDKGCQSSDSPPVPAQQNKKQLKTGEIDDAGLPHWERGPRSKQAKAYGPNESPPVPSLQNTEYQSPSSPPVPALQNKKQPKAGQIDDADLPHWERGPCSRQIKAYGPNDSPPLPVLQHKENDSSGSPPVPALLNKQNVDIVDGKKTAGDADLPHWERPPRVLPALVTKERGRLKIRTNNAMKIRKMLNEREDSVPDRRKNVGRKRPTTKAEDVFPDTYRKEETFSTDCMSVGKRPTSSDTASVDEESLSTVTTHGRSYTTDTNSGKALAFCISPPGKSAKIRGTRQPDVIRGSAHHDDDDENPSAPSTYTSCANEEYYRTNRHTREYAKPWRQSVVVIPPKTKPPRKRLVVRNTRTQNIRKKVAQDILHPEDPPWLRKRKNLQAKIALANNFKIRQERKAAERRQLENDFRYDNEEECGFACDKTPVLPPIKASPMQNHVKTAIANSFMGKQKMLAPKSRRGSVQIDCGEVDTEYRQRSLYGRRPVLPAINSAFHKVHYEAEELYRDECRYDGGALVREELEFTDGQPPPDKHHALTPLHDTPQVSSAPGVQDIPPGVSVQDMPQVSFLRNVQDISLTVSVQDIPSTLSVQDTPQVSSPRDVQDTPQVSSPRDVQDTPQVSSPRDVQDIPQVSSPRDIQDIPQVSSPRDVQDTPQVSSPRDVQDIEQVSSSPGVFYTSPPPRVTDSPPPRVPVVPSIEIPEPDDTEGRQMSDIWVVNTGERQKSVRWADESSSKELVTVQFMERSGDHYEGIQQTTAFGNESRYLPTPPIIFKKPKIAVRKTRAQIMRENQCKKTLSERPPSPVYQDKKRYRERNKAAMRMRNDKRPDKYPGNQFGEKEELCNPSPCRTPKKECDQVTQQLDSRYSDKNQDEDGGSLLQDNEHVSYPSDKAVVGNQCPKHESSNQPSGSEISKLPATHASSNPSAENEADNPHTYDETVGPSLRIEASIISEASNVKANNEASTPTQNSEASNSKANNGTCNPKANNEDSTPEANNEAKNLPADNEASCQQHNDKINNLPPDNEASNPPGNYKIINLPPDNEASNPPGNYKISNLPSGNGAIYTPANSKISNLPPDNGDTYPPGNDKASNLPSSNEVSKLFTDNVVYNTSAAYDVCRNRSVIMDGQSEGDEVTSENQLLPMDKSFRDHCVNMCSEYNSDLYKLGYDKERTCGKQKELKLHYFSLRNKFEVKQGIGIFKCIKISDTEESDHLACIEDLKDRLSYLRYKETEFSETLSKLDNFERSRKKRHKSKSYMVGDMYPYPSTMTMTEQYVQYRLRFGMKLVCPDVQPKIVIHCNGKGKEQFKMAVYEGGMYSFRQTGVCKLLKIYQELEMYNCQSAGSSHKDNIERLYPGMIKEMLKRETNNIVNLLESSTREQMVSSRFGTERSIRYCRKDKIKFSNSATVCEISDNKNLRDQSEKSSRDDISKLPPKSQNEANEEKTGKDFMDSEKTQKVALNNNSGKLPDSKKREVTPRNIQERSQEEEQFSCCFAFRPFASCRRCRNRNRGNTTPTAEVSTNRTVDNGKPSPSRTPDRMPGSSSEEFYDYKAFGLTHKEHIKRFNPGGIKEMLIKREKKQQKGSKSERITYSPVIGKNNYCGKGKMKTQKLAHGEEKLKVKGQIDQGKCPGNDLSEYVPEKLQNPKTRKDFRKCKVQRRSLYSPCPGFSTSKASDIEDVSRGPTPEPSAFKELCDFNHEKELKYTTFEKIKSAFITWKNKVVGNGKTRRANSKVASPRQNADKLPSSRQNADRLPSITYSPYKPQTPLSVKETKNGKDFGKFKAQGMSPLSPIPSPSPPPEAYGFEEFYLGLPRSPTPRPSSSRGFTYTGLSPSPTLRPSTSTEFYLGLSCSPLPLPSTSNKFNAGISHTLALCYSNGFYTEQEGRRSRRPDQGPSDSTEGLYEVYTSSSSCNVTLHPFIPYEIDVDGLFLCSQTPDSPTSEQLYTRDHYAHVLGSSFSSIGTYGDDEHTSPSAAHRIADRWQDITHCEESEPAKYQATSPTHKEDVKTFNPEQANQVFLSKANEKTKELKNTIEEKADSSLLKERNSFEKELHLRGLMTPESSTSVKDTDEECIQGSDTARRAVSKGINAITLSEHSPKPQPPTSKRKNTRPFPRSPSRGPTSGSMGTNARSSPTPVHHINKDLSSGARSHRGSTPEPVFDKRTSAGKSPRVQTPRSPSRKDKVGGGSQSDPTSGTRRKEKLNIGARSHGTVTPRPVPPSILSGAEYSPRVTSIGPKSGRSRSPASVSTSPGIKTNVANSPHVPAPGPPSSKERSGHTPRDPTSGARRKEKFNLGGRSHRTPTPRPAPPSMPSNTKYSPRSPTPGSNAGRCNRSPTPGPTSSGIETNVEHSPRVPTPGSSINKEGKIEGCAHRTPTPGSSTDKDKHAEIMSPSTSSESKDNVINNEVQVKKPLKGILKNWPPKADKDKNWPPKVEKDINVKKKKTRIRKSKIPEPVYEFVYARRRRSRVDEEEEEEMPTRIPAPTYHYTYAKSRKYPH